MSDPDPNKPEPGPQQAAGVAELGRTPVTLGVVLLVCITITAVMSGVALVVWGEVLATRTRLDGALKEQRDLSEKTLAEQRQLSEKTLGGLEAVGKSIESVQGDVKAIKAKLGI